MNWANALAIAEKGFDAWAAKPHNRKWFRKIDGTPIKNDLLVNIATAFAEALIAAPANPAPIAELEPVVALIDELRDLTALRYAGDCKCGKCQLVPRATLDKTIGALRQLEAHAVEQVRAERKVCAKIADDWRVSEINNGDLTNEQLNQLLNGIGPNIAAAICARGQV